jgi:preprotein translocase subunit YajC
MVVGAFAASPLILIAFVALLWFVLIRPMRARQGAQRNQNDSIAPGDEVLTVGGLYGIVQGTDEEGDLIVEIAEGIHVRVARRAIATVVKPEEEEDEAGDEHQPEAPTDGGPATTVTVPDEDASLESTQKRLFGRRS